MKIVDNKADSALVHAPAPTLQVAPVLLIAFNRPDTTSRVFDAIRSAAPARLYVAIDAPRPDRPSDVERCAAVRDVVRVDWPCEVKLLVAPEHRGCRDGVCAALDWFFEQEEEGIILEDDCVPNASFWRFCTEMLERYRFDDRIASIAGSNYEFGRGRRESSYYFSRQIYVWGWATWRRVWQNVDRKLEHWPELRETHWLRHLLRSSATERFWAGKFDMAMKRTIDAWSYFVVYSALTGARMSVVPTKNLTTNIGFGPDAVHTRRSTRYDRMPTEELEFPLVHPHHVMVDEQADRLVARQNYSRHILPRRVWNRAWSDVEAALRRIRERVGARLLSGARGGQEPAKR